MASKDQRSNKPSAKMMTVISGAERLGFVNGNLHADGESRQLFQTIVFVDERASIRA